MKFTYDMHIHSVLSPCGDYLMTPNNILNMAMLCNIDIIALTDHNSTLQKKPFQKIAESYDFLLVYGCELQVQGGHLLVYFKTFEECEEFQEYLDTIIIKEIYDETYYGEQIITDIYDNKIVDIDYYLVNDLDVTLKDLLIKLDDYACLKVLAHLDKNSMSLLKVVDLDDSKRVDAIEVVDNNKLETVYSVAPFLKGKTVLNNSDAHQITDIDERENFLELDELTIECLFEVVKGE